MQRAVYGKTWWGAQWLQALSSIDHDNRLPRGRSYANKGAVRDLAVAGGTIRARVQGSRPQPYAVTIGVPPLEPKQAAKLLDRVAADPALIAQMLNRQLDPAVLDLAAALGIVVFPQRWRDLQMHCSCPDWAVPCKHLAAVIYLLSREIDGDPFLVFSLRGVDLAKALREREIHIEPAAAVQLPTLADLLAGAAAAVGGDAATRSGGAPAVSGNTAAASADAPALSGDAAALEQLDFSAVPDLADPLWRVLPERPAFHPGADFRELGRRTMALVARRARQALESTADADDDFDARDRPQLVIDAANGTVAVAGLASAPAGDFAALAERLARLAPQRLRDVQPQLAALHAVRLLALHLLARGAVVPQLHAATDGVRLRWLPAMLDAAVRELLQRLARGLTPDLLRLRSAGGRAKAKAKDLGALARATASCSLFLDHYVHTWSAAADDKAQGKPGADKVVALFFTTGRARFDGPGEGAVAGSIQTWLSRLHLARHEYAPLLRLDEHDDDFALTLAVERSAAAPQPPVPLATVLTDTKWAQARYAILQQVSVLAEFFAPLAAHVRAGAAAPIVIAPGELPALLFDTLPAVRVLGIRALLPKALERLLRPQLSLRVRAQPGAGVNMLRGGDVLSFDWQVAIGGEALTRAQFERLVASATGVVRFKSGYVYLDPAQIERLRAQLAKPPQVGAAELLRVALAGEYEGAAVQFDARTRTLLQQLLDAGEVRAPRELRATLRPYQQRGYSWLLRNARVGLGSVIADDMGLGKTLQVIATLLELQRRGAPAAAPALVVVPTGLLGNWLKELARFAPTLRVVVFHGSKRELAGATADVLLTSYGVVRREAARLKAIEWPVVVADEAQNIKNPAAAQTRALKGLQARSRIAMSGTPVENRLAEYWSIVDFVNPGYLGTAAHFDKEYAVPIQTHRDAQAAQRFKRVTAPFVLRRLKSDKSIIADLPEKIEQDQVCTLTPAQTALYESVVREGLASLEGVSDTFKRQGLVLQLILALKQVCNHPANYLKQGPRDAALSGKGQRLVELVDEVHAGGEKALVFTQFREMGELLADWLADRHGRRPAFLHGGVSRTQRDEMVDRFQDDRTERLFVLSLKAGGTGLNLTAASQVIHFDLWWNPAVEAQATDRAYRIGQQRNVQVHRLITRATFEERIDEMMRTKRELAELAVGTGERWIGKLPPEELKALFALG